MDNFQNIIIKVKDDTGCDFYLLNAIFKSNKWYAKFDKHDKLLPIYLGVIYNHEYKYKYYEDTTSKKNNKSIILKKIITSSSDKYMHLMERVNDYEDHKIFYLINQRYELHKQFERVIDYAIESSKLDCNSLDVYSKLLSPSSEFDFNKFKRSFARFDLFLDKSKNLNIMIAGSSILSAHEYNIEMTNLYKRWGPNDIDIYIHSNTNQSQTLLSIDSILRQIYKEDKIIIVRSPYTLTYFILINDVLKKWGWEKINDKEKVKVVYQIILSPCKRWEQIYAGYHSDIVCAGYLCLEQQFVTSSRFDYWIKSIGKTVYFFPDLVSPRYRDRVADACEKYRLRNYKVVLVGPFDELRLMDIERSPKLETIFKRQIDVVPFLQKMDDICSIGNSLQDVYYGESFQNIIETMACFRSCPVCGELVFCAEKALYCDMFSNNNKEEDKGCFCDKCFEKELVNLNLLEETLKNKIDTNSLALVTGGRCGLGKEVLDILKNNGIKTFGTTRFPTDDSLIKFDLKESSTWSDVRQLLEDGKVNILVLSASETLHYPDDDLLSERWESKKEEKRDLDWTNDFQRKNSGIWHKTLDQHSYNEIVSPLLTNVAGVSGLLSHFLKGVRQVRANEAKLGMGLRTGVGVKTNAKAFYCCIVVTSFEGSFEKKTPFHPITNACKSAIEQVVWTLKSQAEFLDCPIMLADPGWVFTESSFGKVKGPVPIDFGISQILQPLVFALGDESKYDRNNIITQAPYIFKRKCNLDSNQFVTKKPINIKVQLKPCLCIVTISEQEYKKFYKCPNCDKDIVSRDLPDYDAQKFFIKIAKNYRLCSNIINLILRKAKMWFD